MASYFRQQDSFRVADMWTNDKYMMNIRDNHWDEDGDPLHNSYKM